jgi:dTMP kinase
MNQNTDFRRPQKRGIFIAFEGIDGAGKTTQALALKTRLEEAGQRVRYVKEPTDGPWGRKIRRIAMEGRAHLTLETELDYFIRDREDDVRENIAPALSSGHVVIADRYFYSTIAYQSALGLNSDLIRHLNSTFPVPDVVFMLEISPELSQIRITENRGESANLGYEQKNYLKQVKAVFDNLPDHNIVRIDGASESSTVSQTIWDHTRYLLEQLAG